MRLVNLFQPSVAFHIETSHLICIANQVTVFFLFFFPICVFFHEHLEFTGQQGKGEAISLSPL